MTAAAERVEPDAVSVQMSTVGVAGSERPARVAEEWGLTYVDAPVLGTKQPAASGNLVVLASGPEAIRDRCVPLFEAVGSRTVWLGAAGAGSRLKLVANASALGLDSALFFEAISGGPVDAPYVRLKCTAMVEGRFDPAFAVDGAAKDADLILRAAADAGLQMAVTERVLGYLRDAPAAGHGADDLAAIVGPPSPLIRGARPA